MGDYTLGWSGLHKFLKTHGLTPLYDACINAGHDKLIEILFFKKGAPARICGQIIAWDAKIQITRRGETAFCSLTHVKAGVGTKFFEKSKLRWINRDQRQKMQQIGARPCVFKKLYKPDHPNVYSPILAIDND